MKAMKHTPKIEIYTAMMCGYCSRAKHFFDRKGLPYSEIDVSFHPKKRDEMVSRTGGKRSVPQIMINDVSIGGFTDLVEMDKAGTLEPLLRLK